jgi:hypothetical protein
MQAYMLRLAMVHAEIAVLPIDPGRLTGTG